MITAHHILDDGIVLVSALNAGAENGFKGLTQFKNRSNSSVALEAAGFKFGVKAFLKVLSNYNPSKEWPKEFKLGSI